MSGNKSDDKTEDRELFLDAIGDVRRLETKHAPPFKTKPRPRARQGESDEQSVMQELLSDPSDQQLLESGEHLAWTRDGVQKTVLKKLRGGRYAIQAELDLHGLTQSQAREELLLFIDEAQRRNRKCVRIIHGKGRKRDLRAPVLKPSIDHWLRHHRQVLAFCSARPDDGGTGAVYVLLRK